MAVVHGQLRDRGFRAYLNAVASLSPRNVFRTVVGLPSLVAIACLRGYQRILSPFLAVLFRSSCRFHPSCSEYAVQAVARYGVVRGAFLALGRLLRCHPFHPGGHDPLPQ